MSAPPQPRTRSGLTAAITRADRLLGGGTVAAIVVAAVARQLGQVPAFVLAAVALALLAACVGRAVDALGDRVGPAATGVLQSALGNLPELLILIFALRAGLTTVVQATIVGSILANVALVLGLAFIAGGLKHGTQRFSGVSARDLGLNILLAVAALSIPSLTGLLHGPAAGHEHTLSVIVAAVLLVAFALSLVHTFAQEKRARTETSTTDSDASTAELEPVDEPQHSAAPMWPLWLAVVILAATGLLAALVSDWFVEALSPAMAALHISDAFAGLVIVAIAGNAVENFVGIQLALKNRSEHALQVVLQSPVQIAMFVAPVVLLLAPALGGADFTLVLPPMLLISLLLSAVLAVFITLDGESTWYEGAVLVAIYALIAASFWWG